MKGSSQAPLKFVNTPARSCTTAGTFPVPTTYLWTCPGVAAEEGEFACAPDRRDKALGGIEPEWPGGADFDRVTHI